MRLNVDYRALKRKTVLKSQPIRHIQDSLGGSWWFGTSDMPRAYHQGYMDGNLDPQQCSFLQGYYMNDCAYLLDSRMHHWLSRNKWVCNLLFCDVLVLFNEFRQHGSTHQRVFAYPQNLQRDNTPSHSVQLSEELNSSRHNTSQPPLPQAWAGASIDFNNIIDSSWASSWMAQSNEGYLLSIAFRSAWGIR